MAENGSHSPRTSIDAEPPSDPLESNDVTANGHHLPHHDTDADPDDDVESTDPLVNLQRELDKTRQEKDSLAAQYRNLLAKLTQMRTGLGNKLKQDADELDRREQLIVQLTAQVDDLTSTVETLKEELIASHNEAARASSELDAMRSRALQESAHESLIRERELRQTQLELERCRIEKDDWERVALQEKSLKDDLRAALEVAERDLEIERGAREREALELQGEREKCANLQSVLQDFQGAKDHELRVAVKDYEAQLMQATQSLAEYKHRALTAEMQLEESQTNVERTKELEKEVKEKKLLIDKLRHETIILNEHLVEALRRLRRTSTDTNVDRRLVTNVLLSFLTTPRADGKRFEMLSLLATILSWSEAEREKAGLQKGNGMAPAAGSSFWSRSSGTSPVKSAELDKGDETESFSRLWVEFLLTEAASGESPSTSPSATTRSFANTSLPGTPTGGSFPLSSSRSSDVNGHANGNGHSPGNGHGYGFTPPPPLSKPGSGQRRLSSFSSNAGSSPTLSSASSPNLSMLGVPPLGRKGKEKESSSGSAS